MLRSGQPLAGGLILPNAQKSAPGQRLSAAHLTIMVLRPSQIMKPFALSLSKGIFVKKVVRQAHHERCFTLIPLPTY